MKSKNWLNRQDKDIYVKKAKNDGFVSRSAYKLLEIESKHSLIVKSFNILELGSAPGSWSQVISKINKNAKIDAFDLLDMKYKNDKINFIKYRPVSEFPSSARDFSFSISDIKKYDAVINHLSDLKDKNLKDAFIFDFYENKKLNEIKVGIRFIFQSTLNTLSEKEIQQSVNKLLKPIINLEGVSIPGLD